MKRVILALLCLSTGSVFGQTHVDSLYVTTSDSAKLFVKRSGKLREKGVLYKRCLINPKAKRLMIA